ncbi:hypothetical protein AC1031_004634 [Aphanomyces cochlioides]|nr:hypothetical protein AC1031_004634 [Aphanomyces cochlioides]
MAPTGTASAPRRTRVAWDADGVATNGLPGKSSIDLLLDWLCHLPNYHRWKGDTQHGVTKEALCTEINSILKANGIMHRSNQDIRTKIDDLERSYRTAIDWKANTGQGILDSDALDDNVMRDRPSFIPLLISDTMDESSLRIDAVETEVSVDQPYDDDGDSFALDESGHGQEAEKTRPEKRKVLATSTNNRGRSKKLFDGLKSLLNDLSDVEKGRLEIESSKLRIEEERLHMDKNKK